MIVDLHSHFPMHIDAELDSIPPGGRIRRKTLEAIRDLHRGRHRPQKGRRPLAGRRPSEKDMLHSRHRRQGFLPWLKALVLDIASRIGNYRSWDAGPAVTVDKLMTGNVGVALSVLYQPFDEMDLEHFGQEPRGTYFRDLRRQLERVEDAIAQKHKACARVVRNPRELSNAVTAGALAVVHVVEGGFHLGATPTAIAKNVHTLARLGVAYITVAHLFWRGIASNAPALPFLSDAWYRLLFHEPEEGLTGIGGALIDAMAREHILVDVTHMTETAMWDTFDRLPADAPVIASHVAVRGPGRKYSYNLSDHVIRKIVRRGGVLGVIMCDHFCNEGHAQTRTLEQSIDAIYRQIDHIKEIAGTHDHVAIGTDLDGFIKPTLAGLDDASKLEVLEEKLARKYGRKAATNICSGNALRLLSGYWRGRRGK